LVTKRQSVSPTCLTAPSFCGVGLWLIQKLKSPEHEYFAVNWPIVWVTATEEVATAVGVGLADGHDGFVQADRLLSLPDMLIAETAQYLSFQPTTQRPVLYVVPRHQPIAVAFVPIASSAMYSLK
jgi:hypothetical protein